MAIKTAEEIINGKTVKIVLLKALAGIKITSELSKVVVPAIAALQESGDMSKLE